MSGKELRALLKNEQARCTDALVSAEPGSDLYIGILRSIETLMHMTADLMPEHESFPAQRPCETVAGPVESDVATTTAEEAPTEDGTDWGEYRLALRADLAGARQQGVNTTELLQAVGAGKYSEVPDHKLPDLRAELEKALANKENG